MNRLHFLDKGFFLIMFSIVLLAFVSSCNGEDENRYETRYSKDGKDSVVYVHYRDERGQYQDFFMNYLMFRTIFSGTGYNGYSGYAACSHYYAANPTVINNYHTYSTRASNSGYTSSAPSTNSYNSPVRSNSSSSKSYISPSRSYNSPSRSYTSPSRSYSSPSRSYSNPTRSYSSPSRH